MTSHWEKNLRPLPYQDVPGFVAALRGDAGQLISRLALEFLILTCRHAREAAEAEHGEFDLSQRIWTLPAERSQTHRPLIVPLSPSALRVVLRAREVDFHRRYLFPGRRSDAALTARALRIIVQRLAFNTTISGFRLAFAQWATASAISPEIIDAVLGLPGSNAGLLPAGMMADLREVLEAWGDFATGTKR